MCLLRTCSITFYNLSRGLPPGPGALWLYFRKNREDKREHNQEIEKTRLRHELNERSGQNEQITEIAHTAIDVIIADVRGWQQRAAARLENIDHRIAAQTSIVAALHNDIKRRDKQLAEAINELEKQIKTLDSLLNGDNQAHDAPDK